MNKKCFAAILILLILLAGGAYKFLFQGSLSAGGVCRAAILLTPGERDLALAQMRTFLEGIQQISQALVAEDMSTVAVVAKHSGFAAQGAVPGSLIGKLPLDFKKLGFNTHSRFEQLTMDVGDLGDPAHTQAQLATLMLNRVACHADYRIAAVARD